MGITEFEGFLFLFSVFPFPSSFYPFFLCFVWQWFSAQTGLGYTLGRIISHFHPRGPLRL